MTSLLDFKQLLLKLDSLVNGLDQTGVIFVLGLFSLLCVFFSGFSLLLYIRSRSILGEVRQELQILGRKVEVLEQSRQEKTPNQKPDLDPNKLKSRFEEMAGMNRRVPEKYRYLSELERSGLGLHELSEILDVSQVEAKQMLSLARTSSTS